MDDVDEKVRLLSYFSHRYVTLISILKEVARTKRLMKGKAGPSVVIEQS